MRTDVSHIHALPNRIAQVRRVMCVQALEISEPNVIAAFRVQTKLGWTDVLAVSAPDDTDRQIGSLHIRTLCPTLPFPTKVALGQAHEQAVLMSYAPIDCEIGIEARSRLPIFAERSAFDALVPAIEHLVRLQWLMLIGSFQNCLRARQSIAAMGPYRPSRHRWQAALEDLRNSIKPHGFRLIETDTGCVVVERNDPSCTRECRIEVSTDVVHDLLGPLFCADLVVPWDQDSDAHTTADLLNFRNQTVENATLGVGAWHPNREDGTLRYRILVAFFEKWSPRLDLFVSDLVMRWMNFTGTGIAQTLDRDQADAWGTLFATMRADKVKVSETLHRSQDAKHTLDDYFGDRAARELTAATAGMSVQALGRYLGPPLRRPRQKTQRKRPKS